MKRVGTAGWAVPRAVADQFPPEGSTLQRYAARFDAAEINATFYRMPRRSTLERWRDDTPEGFRFSVKLPKAVSHEQRLVDCHDLVAGFLDQIAPLEAKLGPLLLQLPPKLAFDAGVAGPLFERLRRDFDGPVACEPRHPSWFEAEADALLDSFRIARVAADPIRADGADRPGGWRGFSYWRLHGSPRVYWSAYGAAAAEGFAAALRDAPDESWCVFDNTASGAAAADALMVAERLAG